MCLLLITSSISMQLFCFLQNLKQFETFPRVCKAINVVFNKLKSSQAYMSMFRIAMNDGWTDVMYSTMDNVYEFGIFFLYLTALFFIFFHLLTNTVSFPLRDNIDMSMSMNLKCIFDKFDLPIDFL